MEPAFTIGNHAVYHVEEWQGGFAPPCELFAEYQQSAFEKHRAEFEPEYFREGVLYAFLQSFVIDTGNQVILVDTGAGNDKPRPNIAVFENLDTPFLAKLAEKGFAPETIDIVFCTHLHIDHVGWNTRLIDGKWVPTFPNAQYVFPRVDDIHWNPQGPHFGRMHGADVNLNVYEDSVQPVIEAGMVRFVDDGDEVAAGMVANSAPGHTPGHMVLEVSNSGQTALFTGDILHHPMQIFRPDWNSVYCEDREQAVSSRRRVLERAADLNARIVPAHFAGVHSVFVDRNRDGFRPRFG